MARLKPMTSAHFEALFGVLKAHDPLFDSPSYDHFAACMQALEGWAVTGNGQVVGMVGLSDFRPGLNVVIHGVVDPAWRGRWITRRNLEVVFGKIFGDLRLPRVSGYMVVGINLVQLDPFFRHLGFQIEGYVRKGFRLKGTLHDLVTVGMLREECRWVQ